MSHAERAYLETLSSLDIAITFLIGLLNLSGAVALFMLRRAAFGLFAAALGASFLAFLWRAAIAVPPLAAGEPGFIGALVGFGLSTAVCFYTWRLMRRGMLV